MGPVVTVAFRRIAAVHFMLLSLAAVFLLGEPQPGSPSGIVRQAPIYVTTDFPWQMFHHDPQHTGYSQTTAPPTNNLLWSTTTGGVVDSSPSVIEGIVFVGSSDNHLYALDESSGGILWTWMTGAAVTASPAAGGGTVYVASQDRTLFALNARTGQLRWSSVYISPISSSPTLADGMVFFGTSYSATSGTAQLLSLHATTGATIWSFNWPASITTSPSVNQGRVFVGTEDGWIVALGEMSGTPVWQYQIGAGPVSTPAVSAGTVYAVTSRNRVLALDESSGVPKWTRTFGGPQNPTPSSPAVGDGRLVFGIGNGQVIALDATTGNILWAHDTAGTVSSSPALTIDTVLVGSNDNNLYALSLNSGVLKWTFATGAAVVASPALADGIVFFASQDGAVYAIGQPVPVLQVGVSAIPTRVRSHTVSEITITVTANGSPQDAVSLIITSSIGNFTFLNYKGAGVYVAEYSAPLVGATTAVSIAAAAYKPGFLSGNGQIMITVEPPAPMSLSVTVSSRSVSPGTSAKLTVQVRNGSLPVVGANITALSTIGNFSDGIDLGNGDYAVDYWPPERDFKEPTSVIIFVAATKPGFQAASTTTQLVVYGLLPQPFVFPELPIVPIGIVGVAVSASALGAYWFKSRKKEEKPRFLESSLEFRDALLRAVDSASELVGPNVWKNIMETVEYRYGVTTEQIPDQLDAFDLGLIATLGQGAYLVRKLIVERLYAELGLDAVSPINEDFITAIRNAQAELLSPKKKRQ